MLTLFSLLCLWVANCKTIAIGDSHTCVVQSNMDTYCFGLNTNGQLGVGSSVTQSGYPVKVNGGFSATDICAGSLHTCWVITTGSVLCTGDNSKGQLGDSTTTSRFTPVFPINSSALSVSCDEATEFTVAYSYVPELFAAVPSCT